MSPTILLALVPAFLHFVQDPDPIRMSPPVKSEEYDFEIALPAGWETSKTSGQVFFRIQARAGTLADGAAWLRYHDSNHPVSLAFLTENFRSHAKTEYPGFEPFSENSAPVGGFPAYRCVFFAKAKDGRELAFVHTVIQRQLQEYFILDAVAAKREKDRIVAIADKMLATFRSGLAPNREREGRIARTAAVLKSAPARPGMAGTQWHELIIAKRKLGWQKSVLREARVDGVPGWEFEVELRQEDVDGGMRSDAAKGSFTADGSIQHVEFHRVVETPKDPRVEVKESASLVKGEYHAMREFLDMKVEKKFAAPEGTILGDIAVIMRRRLALAPPGKYTLRILDPFRDLATFEEWETSPPGRIRVDGEDRELITALVTPARQDPWEYLYDPDGTLHRVKGPKGVMILRHCTEEEARKR